MSNQTTIGAIRATSDRKTRKYKTQCNTFGLLPGNDGGTCPYSTCKAGGCWHVPEGRKLPDCYVAKLMSAYGGVQPILEHNTKLLMGATEKQMTNLLRAEFRRFLAAEVKRNGSAVFKTPPLYRMHWSGDVFNAKYARAIAAAVNVYPEINFWMYTRSFKYVPILCNIPNLILYLSLDPVNTTLGLKTFLANKSQTNSLGICYMSKTNNLLEHMKTLGIEAPPELNKYLKLSTCPVDTGKMELEGGCMRCQQCTRVLNNKSIWFKS